MDTGIQLGRRFRALKLWMVLRYFGAEGLRARLAEHMRLARALRRLGRREPAFERVAPTCRSASSASAPRRRAWTTRRRSIALNERLLEAVNATGEIFLSHTRLDGRYVLRLAVGNLRTTEAHVARAWELFEEHAARLRAAM